MNAFWWRRVAGRLLEPLLVWRRMWMTGVGFGGALCCWLSCRFAFLSSRPPRVGGK
jgi:hypothetical protein